VSKCNVIRVEKSAWNHVMRCISISRGLLLYDDDAHVYHTQKSVWVNVLLGIWEDMEDF